MNYFSVLKKSFIFLLSACILGCQSGKTDSHHDQEDSTGHSQDELEVKSKNFPVASNSEATFSFDKTSASDGLAYSLNDLLSKKKPIFLYFIQSGCPMNAKAIQFYEMLSNKYGEAAEIVGVINANKAGFEEWKQAHSASFPKGEPSFKVLFDPELKIIDGYHAERSPWVVKINTDKSTGYTWKGFSKDYLAQLNAEMGKVAGVEHHVPSLSNAPDRPKFG